MGVCGCDNGQYSCTSQDRYALVHDAPPHAFKAGMSLKLPDQLLTESLRNSGFGGQKVDNVRPSRNPARNEAYAPHAIFAAILRASSLLSSLAAGRRPGCATI
jgi:hypothetical protein